MPAVKIVGPERIADSAGTYEPGQIIENPSEALLDLARNGTLNEETGKPYVVIVEVGSRRRAPEEPPAPENG